MDALILSCGTGGGHNGAAKAIAAEMKKRGNNVKLLNPYTLYSKKLARTINKTYISTAQNAPKLFGTVYKIADVYRELPFHSPVYHINRNMNSVLKAYLAENSFDIIITTHLFCAEILTNMRNHGSKLPPLIFVATDYVCVPFTEETDCDAYIVPTKESIREYVLRGIPLNKLFPLGIPTAEAFACGETKTEARKRLNMCPQEKHILIAGGSMGGGTMADTLKVLKNVAAKRPDTHLTVICGSNKQLLEKLLTENDENVTTIGYTDDMAGYIKACDIFVTKPGGITSTEAAVSGTPLIHAGGIPGCETGNAEYFKTHGMCLCCDTDEKLTKAVYRLLDDPALCEKMINNQKKHISKRSAAKICTLAEEFYINSKAAAN